jgi:hypothetical protein
MPIGKVRCCLQCRCEAYCWLYNIEHLNQIGLCNMAQSDFGFQRLYPP